MVYLFPPVTEVAGFLIVLVGFVSVVWVCLGGILGCWGGLVDAVDLWGKLIYLVLILVLLRIDLLGIGGSFLYYGLGYMY